MRCFIAVDPKEIEELIHSGSKIFSNILFLAEFEAENEDVEEREFELSLLAARDSLEKQVRQGKSNPRGYVLAVDLASVPKDQPLADQSIAWADVDSILVADSHDEELSWYARQEVEIFLPNWLS